MRGYQLERRGDTWQFRFIPGNSKTQEIGISAEYASREDCLRAISELRGLIVGNQINSLDSPFIRITKMQTGLRVEYHNNGSVVFCTRTYVGTSARINCAKTVASIFRHIDEYTSREVWEGL